MTADTASIWHAFSDRVKRFIRKSVANEADAEDVLQDVFTRIHSGLGGIRDTAKLEPWIFQVTRFAIVDHLRARTGLKRTLELPEELAEDRPATGVSAIVATWLEPLMEGLTEEDREALRITFEAASQKSLAAKWKVSDSTARSRVQRARRRLKDVLLKCCEIEMDRRGQAISYKRRASDCRNCSCD